MRDLRTRMARDRRKRSVHRHQRRGTVSPFILLQIFRELHDCSGMKTAYLASLVLALTSLSCVRMSLVTEPAGEISRSVRAL